MLVAAFMALLVPLSSLVLMLLSKESSMSVDSVSMMLPSDDLHFSTNILIVDLALSRQLLLCKYKKKIQSNFNGSNTFGTMKISSRQG